MNVVRERNAFWWLLLILIIATVLRTYQLDRFPPGLYPDEAMNGNNAVSVMRSGDYKIYYPENNGREGLFMNIQTLSLRLFGGVHEPWVLRFPSAIIGILTVWGLYLLGKEIFSKRVGLLASFFLATSVWHIIFSRIGFRAILAPFFLAWALYLLHLALRNGREEAGRPWSYFIPAILGGLLFGLGFHTYIAYRVAPILLLVFWWFFRNGRNFWKVAALFLIAAFLAGLPIGIYYLGHPADFFGRTSQISVWSGGQPLRDLALNIWQTIGMFFWAGDGNWRHNVAGRPELFWPVAFLFLWGLILGGRSLWRRHHPHLVPVNRRADKLESWEAIKNLPFAFSLLFAWLVVSFLPVVISNEGIPHALRSILMLPAAMLFAGAGAVAIYTFFETHMKTSLLGAGAIIMSLLVLEAFQTYFILYGPNHQVRGAFNQDYLDVGHILNRVPASTPKYVVVEAGGTLVNGIPMPTQTVMFLTDTFTPEEQAAKNMHYVTSSGDVPPGFLKLYLR